MREKYHGVIDYTLALFLISIPYYGNFIENPVSWALIAIGVLIFVNTGLAKHEAELIGKIKFKHHLMIDVVLGISLVAAGYVLTGYAGILAYVSALILLANSAASKGQLNTRRSKNSS